MDGGCQRGGCGFGARLFGEAGNRASGAANHRPHCGEGGDGSRGKMVGQADSSSQRGIWRDTELLFRTLVGTPGAETSSCAPSRCPLAAASGRAGNSVYRTSSASSRAIDFYCLGRYADSVSLIQHKYLAFYLIFAMRPSAGNFWN